MTEEEILGLIDRKIIHREKSFRGFTRNQVNIKQKRSLYRIQIGIQVLKQLKRQIAEG